MRPFGAVWGFGRSDGRGSEGFTLLEMIVVVLLIGLLLGFAMPRMREPFPLASTEHAARWLAAQVPMLKNKAREEQRDYDLVLDLDRNRMWIRVAAAPDRDDTEGRRLGMLALPPEVNLVEVVRQGRPPQRTGRAVIRFYARGHSDKAVLHCRDRGGRRTAFAIEPFLAVVERHEDGSLATGTPR